MYRPHSECNYGARLRSAVGHAFFAIALLAFGGCATPGEIGDQRTSAALAGSAASEASADGLTGRAILKRPARIEFDSSVGFTVTEVANIDGAARADYVRAQQFLESGDYDAGIELLRQVVERAPHLSAPFIDLGIAHATVGNLSEAESNLRDALTLVPKHPAVHNELGIVHRKQGRFDDARHRYERALELHPSFHFARRNLAVLCDLYLADLNCARQHYEIYRQQVPDDPEVVLWLRDLAMRQATGS